VISSGGKGDQPVESLEVKVPMAGDIRSDPFRGRANWQAVAKREPLKPRNLPPRETDLRETWECRAGQHSVKADVDVPALELMDVELPEVGEDGMSGRNVSESPEPLAGRLGAPAQRRHRI